MRVKVIDEGRGCMHVRVIENNRCIYSEDLTREEFEDIVAKAFLRQRKVIKDAA